MTATGPGDEWQAVCPAPCHHGAVIGGETREDALSHIRNAIIMILAEMELNGVSPPADEPAFGWPNLIVQPHSAWYSPAASLAPYTRQIDDLARFLRGEQPDGVIPGGS